MKPLALWAFAAALAATPAAAQQEKVVDGLVVNLGLMSAEKAVHAEGHRDAHPATFPSGSQHVLITLVEANLHTQAAGLADYSELFRFGSAGRYSLRVKISPPQGKRTETVFTVNHQI
jgi:hypothetical protein